jgi:hypothetical protein
MPKNIRVNDQQSRSLQLSWTQPYAGNSAITNYIIQYKLVSGTVCLCHMVRTNSYIVGLLINTAHHKLQFSWDIDELHHRSIFI